MPGSPAPFAVEVDAADAGGWARALRPLARDARALLDAFLGEVRLAVRPLGPLGPPAVRAFLAAVSALHRARGAPRSAELDALAEAVGARRQELLLANLAYDLAAVAPLAGPGCSTFVSDGPRGPLHARNLDWRFPGELLRRHVHAFAIRGAPAGPYAVVGWPGLVGALTGVARGRFSVSVNFVRLRGEHLGRVLARLARGALPVPWAVRDALDHARTYDEAVARLRAVPLLAPAILTLAGPRAGEGCVVERTWAGAAVRPLAGPGGTVCATNHALAPGLAGRSVDYDEGSSLERLAAIAPRAATARDVRSALEVLAPTMRDEVLQHQVVMRAADGLCVVRVPGQRPRRVRVPT